MIKHTHPLGKAVSSTESIYRAKVNTRRVKFLKHIFPAIAVFLALLLLVWPYLKDQMTPDMPELRKIERAQLKSNKVLAPSMHSLDRHGRAFKLKANSALKNSDKDVVTHLEKPHSELEDKEKGPMSIQAHEGDFDQSKQVLHYNHDVTLKTGDGFVLKTEQADLNVKEHKAVGHEPVKGRGPAGDVDAKDGFEADKDTIYFKGQTKMIFKQGEPSAAK